MGQTLSAEQASLPFAFAAAAADARAAPVHPPDAAAPSRAGDGPPGPADADPPAPPADADDADGAAAPDDEALRAIRFGQLTSLVTIGLCSQGLVRLAPNVGLLYATTTLQLCCNNLTSIPSEIGHLQNLQILSVARNRLTELPDTIGYLAKLVELRAADNCLRSLPPSIGMLKKLTTLSAENNELASLPMEIGGVTALVNLDLSGNPIRTLPAEIGRLKFLRKLRLEECPLLTEFEYPPTNPCPSLKELSARVIVRNQLPILQDTQEELKAYLASAQSCSFCGGPYFESCVKRYRQAEKNEFRFCVEYSLCVAHWTTEQERWALGFGIVWRTCANCCTSRDRISALFCPPPETAPSPIASSPSTTPPSSPLFGRRRRTSQSASGMSRSNSVTLPLSSAISKSPSLPDLPPVEAGTAPRNQSVLARSRSISSLLSPTRSILRSTSFSRG
ncbi:hypothetical protein DFJ74DRAFT_96804 [Hyaloraphidium curvatum]|nr:hypothetical protein DFJ74DRAFT_96804 [Hyaloraphidium curvatum]